MSKTTLQELVVKFTGDSKGLQQAVGQAENSIKSVTTASGLATTALKSMAAAVSVGAIANAARQTLSWADDLGDLAQTLGVTTEKVQALQYAAVANGSSVEEVNQAMLRFTQAVGDAATAGGPLLERMQQLGINVRDANGQIMGMGELLPQVANAIANATTAQEKLSIATDFFGRQAAPSMVRLLGEGAQKLTELEAAALSAGAVLDEETIKKAAEVNSQFELLTLTLGNKFKSAILETIDFFRGVAGAASDAANAVGRFFGISTDQGPYATPVNDQGPFAEPYAIPVGNEGPYAIPVGTSGGPTQIASRSGRSAATGAAVQTMQKVQQEAKKASASVDSLKTVFMQTDYTAQKLDNTFDNTFKDLATSIARGENALDSLRRVALNTIGQIFDGLNSINSGGSAGGGLGGFLATAIGGVFGMGGGKAKVPKFDVGSPYVPRDMLAMLHQGEMIIPAAKAASMRSGGGATVVQNINVSTGVAATVRAEMMGMLPQLKQAAIAGVVDAQQRGAI